MARGFRWAALFLALTLVLPMTMGAASAPPRVTDAVIVIPDQIRFEPTATNWDIDFGVLTSGTPKPLRVKSVEVGGLDAATAMDTASTSVTAGEVKNTSRTELARFGTLYKKAIGMSLSASEVDEYLNVNEKVQKGIDRTVCPSRIRLDIGKLPLAVKDQGSYPVTITLTDEATTMSAMTTVVVAALPSDTGWSPADLHLHSTWSDGNFTPYELRVNLASKGYKILYFTDHRDLISTWASYSSDVTTASSSTLACYPGVETTTVSGTTAMGDVTAYGIKDFTGIYNMGYTPQTTLVNIGNNNPGVSSASIAHPMNGWSDWTVTASSYKGFELMSGVQYAFDETASPMVTWRSEVARRLGVQYLPSARAGSDYHGNLGDPLHAGFVTWVRTGQWNSKSAVDAALYQSSTVCSKMGGLAYFTLTHDSTLANVGGTLSGVSSGDQLSLNITVKPSVTGSYTVKLYSNNSSNSPTTIWSSVVSMTAGTTNTLGTGIKPAFSGTTTGYYVVVSGPDYIYTTPITVKP